MKNELAARLSGRTRFRFGLASRLRRSLMLLPYFFTFGGTIASLALFAMRNLTTFFAAILIVSPVAGFRARKAGLDLFTVSRLLKNGCGLFERRSTRRRERRVVLVSFSSFSLPLLVGV